MPHETHFKIVDDGVVLPSEAGAPHNIQSGDDVIFSVVDVVPRDSDITSIDVTIRYEEII
jgi:hypothetical protein